MKKTFLLSAFIILSGVPLRAETAAARACKAQLDGQIEKLRRNPNDNATWTDFRACVNELKRWHTAETLAKEVLAKNPNLWQPNLILGIVQLHTKEYDKAVDTFDRTIELKPDNAPSYYYLGMAYLFSSRISDAAQAANRAVELDPQNASYHSQLAYALLLTDDRERCEIEAKKAIDIDRNNIAAYKVLGNLYKKQGKMRESDQAFEEAMHANGRIASGDKKIAVLPGMGPAPAATGIIPNAPGPTPVSTENPGENSDEEPDSKGPGDTIAYCRAQWNAMREAMLRGDTERALGYFSDYAGTRDQYRQSFKALGTDRLKKMFGALGDLYDCQVVLAATTCKSSVSSNQNGVLHAIEQTVRFERNPDKVWRIRSF